jgi:hypothetical protein
VLWELFEPFLDGSQVIFGSARISVVVGGILVDRKTDARGTFQEKHVGIVVPGERIFGGSKPICTLVENVGTMFLQETCVISKLPRRLEQPGPPLSQSTTSLLAAFLELTKM